MQLERTQRDAEAAGRLGGLWRVYAEKVYGPDYPLYRAIALAVADDGEVLDFLLSCRPEAHDPNMLLAGIQYLVLGGSRHRLADLYGRAASFSAEAEEFPGGIGDLVGDFCRRHRAELSALLDSRHIQTNETGRCGAIALGLIEAAKLIGEPIALIDDGASALVLDEYLLDFGPAGRIGPQDSPVHLRFEVRGTGPPGPFRLPVIARRTGIDRMPIDVGDEDAVRWLLACIWPGTGRQERARGAMTLAADRPGLVRRGDMVGALGPALEEMHPAPTVVVTSSSYSYLSLEGRHDFMELLRAEGRRRPVAWVFCDLLGTEPLFEPPSPPPKAEELPGVLGVAVFDGERTQAGAAAFMHSHGAWLRWIGASPTAPRR